MKLLLFVPKMIHKYKVNKVQYSLESMIEQLKNNGLFDIYKFQAKELFNYSFFKSRGLHGISHAQRILFLSLVLYVLERMPSKYLDVIINGAIYHDIGRTHDLPDKRHGEKSFKKIIEYNLVKYKNQEKLEILKYIIENHCIKDKIAFKNLKNYDIKNTEIAQHLLKILKDADSLDRVRGANLRLKYLRTDSSNHLVFLAYNLLENYKTILV